jgi:P27 family predicted phage terminase small subunit
MSKPALSAAEASLHMRRRDVNRVSRAKDTTVPIPGGKPKMPDGLTEGQQKLWKTIVKQLRVRRTVTPGDAQIVTLYVRTHTQWMAACDYVDAHGPIISEQRFSQAGTPYTVDIPNPAMKIVAALGSRLESLLKEMGLTGISRGKVPPVKSRDKEPPAEGTALWYASLAKLPDRPLLDVEVTDEELGVTDGLRSDAVRPGDSEPIPSADAGPEPEA